MNLEKLYEQLIASTGEDITRNGLLKTRSVLPVPLPI